jgi:hypothetical protein
MRTAEIGKGAWERGLLLATGGSVVFKSELDVFRRIDCCVVKNGTISVVFPGHSPRVPPIRCRRRGEILSKSHEIVSKRSERAWKRSSTRGWSISNLGRKESYVSWPVLKNVARSFHGSNPNTHSHSSVGNPVHESILWPFSLVTT